MPPTRRVIGLMSGTSADGIDAVLAEISGSGATLQAKVLGHEYLEYEPKFREQILNVAADTATVRDIARLNKQLGEKFAEAALKCIERFGPVDLIGSHGQTICHLPDEGATFQIGEPSIIAQRTGVTVVANFRQADMAVGGQGAPLVPYVDWALFRSPHQNRVLLNIGGIANCTILPADCSLEQVRGWDTGPGNMVMDYWTQRLWNKVFDENGKLAAQGKVNQKWLETWLNHPFFHQKPPKTAGREEFGADFAALPSANQSYEGWGFDVLATAASLTAKTIAQSLKDHSNLNQFELFVSGGGAHNNFLMQQLQLELLGHSIQPLDSLGVLPQHKEGLAFAILAHETMNGVPSNVPSVTGAERAVVLGKITLGDKRFPSCYPAVNDGAGWHKPGEPGSQSH